MGVTKGASESKDVRTHKQQSRNVRRFKRAGQPAHHVERTALGAELTELHDLEMREKTAAHLVAGVQHCALEVQLPELGEEREIRLFVGKHHADEGDVACEPAQWIAETIESRRIDCESNVIGPHLRQRSRAVQQSSFSVGWLAERRARFASTGDCGDRLARDVERDGSERALPRLSQIDDVGPKLRDGASLDGVGDTGEQARHGVASCSLRSPEVRSARACDAEGCPPATRP